MLMVNSPSISIFRNANFLWNAWTNTPVVETKKIDENWSKSHAQASGSWVQESIKYIPQEKQKQRNIWTFDALHIFTSVSLRTVRKHWFTWSFPILPLRKREQKQKNNKNTPRAEFWKVKTLKKIEAAKIESNPYAHKIIFKICLRRHSLSNWARVTQPNDWLTGCWIEGIAQRRLSQNYEMRICNRSINKSTYLIHSTEKVRDASNFTNRKSKETYLPQMLIFITM